MNTTTLNETITQAYQQIHCITAESVDESLKQAIHQTIEQLDQGTLRVAEKINGAWQVNAWLREAILLYFKITPNQLIDSQYTRFYDKVPLKFADMSQEQIANLGVRVVPDAIVRKGAYVAGQTVLMPSFTNIGAYVDSGCMIDTWATVGCCAQIGKNVHLSGGAGIGGVLEPLQNNPTIIEDNCFIGARSEVVEGVIVEAGSVLSMGVYIGQSTPIYNELTNTISYGRIPPYSVVIPGSIPAKNGNHHRYAVIIIKQVDESTRKKVSLNELLRAE